MNCITVTILPKSNQQVDKTFESEVGSFSAQILSSSTSKGEKFVDDGEYKRACLS